MTKFADMKATVAHAVANIVNYDRIPFDTIQ